MNDKTPTPTPTQSQLKLQAAEKALVDIGIDHFIILVPPDDLGTMVTLFHQMKSSDTMNLLINGIPNAIDHELAANPTYHKSYKKIFTDFKRKFLELVTDVNVKVAQFDAKTEEK